eukprot:6308615-Amphidinium_carterae.1
MVVRTSDFFRKGLFGELLAPLYTGMRLESLLGGFICITSLKPKPEHCACGQLWGQSQKSIPTNSCATDSS